MNQHSIQYNKKPVAPFIPPYSAQTAPNFVPNQQAPRYNNSNNPAQQNVMQQTSNRNNNANNNNNQQFQNNRQMSYSQAPFNPEYTTAYPANMQNPVMSYTVPYMAHQQHMMHQQSMEMQQQSQNAYAYSQQGVNYNAQPFVYQTSPENWNQMQRDANNSGNFNNPMSNYQQPNPNQTPLLPNGNAVPTHNGVVNQAAAYYTFGAQFPATAQIIQQQHQGPPIFQQGPPIHNGTSTTAPPNFIAQQGNNAAANPTNASMQMQQAQNTVIPAPFVTATGGAYVVPTVVPQPVVQSKPKKIIPIVDPKTKSVQNQKDIDSLMLPAQQQNTQPANTSTTVEEKSEKSEPVVIAANQETSKVVPEVQQQQPKKEEPEVSSTLPTTATTTTTTKTETVKEVVEPPKVVEEKKEEIKEVKVEPTVVAVVEEKKVEVVPSEEKKEDVEKSKPETVEAKPLAVSESSNSNKQWSPENPDGKKRYDREFLLSLRNVKLSKVLSEKIITMLKDLNVYKDSAGAAPMGKGSYGGGANHNSGIGGMGGGSASMNTQFQRQKSGHQGSKIKSTPSRGSYGSMPHTEINLNKDIQFKKADNPYVIKKLTDSQLNEQEELLRDVRNILNKMTPQNLTKLTGDLLNLPINTEEKLEGAIDVIFEKCLDEQIFSQTYSQVCKVLSSIKVPLSSDSTKFTNFRTMLLTKCQKEFDSDYSQSINYDKLLEEMEACADEKRKSELKEEAEYKLTKAKRRSLGNIRFIGELFKLEMLTDKIMHNCIERLLKQETDEENLECLCKLLATIGRALDITNNATRMKSYFDRMEKISKKKETVSSRIRFMLLDVIDLRKNQWTARRKENGPRKIEEIRKEAEEEKLRAEAELAKQQSQQQYNRGSQQGQRNPKYQQGQNNNGGGGGGLSKSSSMDIDTYRASKLQPGNMVNKIKDVKTITINKNSSDLVLGPSGSSFSWNKPKPPQQQQPAAAETTTPPATANITPATSNLSLTSGSSFNKQQSSSNKNSQDSSYQNKAYKKRDSLSSNGSRNASRANSMTREKPKTTSATSKKAYSDEEIERKANNTIDEYLQNKSLDEALRDIEEFQPIDSDQLNKYVEQIIMVVLERSDQARESIGNLLSHSLTKNVLDTSNFVEGLKSVLSVADDMAIDIPKIKTYLSQIIAPLLNANLNVSFLLRAFEPIVESVFCADLISEVLHTAAARLGHSTLVSVFKKSGLKLDDFLVSLPSSEREGFIKKNKLEWMLLQQAERERTVSASTSSSSSNSLESFEKRLGEILAEQSNEIIFDKIESEFEESLTSGRVFIRALVLSVCKSCLDRGDKIDTVLLKKRACILNRFLNKKAEFELEALYAIQALDHRKKHQPGFIQVLFDLFYDEDIVGEEVFWKWKDEAREEGHGISALALKAFFEWLKEADNQEQD